MAVMGVSLRPEPAAPPGEIEVAADGMCCTVTLAAPLAPAQIVARLAALGVAHGVDLGAIARMADGKHLAEPVVVARGTPPKHGQDAVVVYRFRTDKSDAPFALDPNGRVDFHELHAVQNVRAGQVLAEKFPPTRGQAGTTVRGESAPARDGEDHESILAGKNTSLSADGTRLVATRDGQVVFARNVVAVDNVLEVKGDIDFKSGNVDFVGSIIVDRDVHDGFRVVAAGNVNVFGVVGAAYVTAHGDVVVKRGVVGGAVSSLEAGGDVVVKFVDGASIRAYRDVLVGGEVLNGHVRAGRNVRCEGPRAAIVGGQVSAGETIVAATLGSKLGVVTRLEAGVSAAERRRVVAAARPTRQASAPPALELQALQARMRRARIVAKRLFAGVKLSLNGIHFEVLEEMGPTIFVERDGEVVHSRG